MSDLSNKTSQPFKMQILSDPIPREDISVKVTLTGLTILKQGHYHSRHELPKGSIQTHTNHFYTQNNYRPFFAGDDPWKKKEKKQVKKVPSIQNKQPSKRVYSINKKEVVHRIRGFLNQMKGEKQLYFWTVTFPLHTTDDTAFQLFNKWLTRLRQEKMLKSYLWVSERQENGTIHFHIAIPHRMDIKKSNRYMRAAMFTSLDQLKLDWTREKAKNYNGVDISKDRKTRRITNFAKRKKEKALSNYLTKYISKNDEYFSHLAWHCSRDYSNIILSFRLTQEEHKRLQLSIYTSKEKVFENEWCYFYRWDKKPPDKVAQYLAFVNQIAQSQLN
jgi:hypothetical protein